MIYAILTLLLFGDGYRGGSDLLSNWRWLSSQRNIIDADGIERREFMALAGVFMSVTLGFSICWFALPPLFLNFAGEHDDPSPLPALSAALRLAAGVMPERRLAPSGLRQVAMRLTASNSSSSTVAAHATSFPASGRPAACWAAAHFLQPAHHDRRGTA